MSQAFNEAVPSAALLGGQLVTTLSHGSNGSQQEAEQAAGQLLGTCAGAQGMPTKSLQAPQHMTSGAPATDSAEVSQPPNRSRGSIGNLTSVAEVDESAS